MGGSSQQLQMVRTLLASTRSERRRSFQGSEPCSGGGRKPGLKDRTERLPSTGLNLCSKDDFEALNASLPNSGRVIRVSTSVHEGVSHST